MTFSSDFCAEWTTYMNRPVPLLHMIGCQEVCYPSQPMKEAIFEAKNGSGTDDGCLWENAACNFLTSGLPVISTQLSKRFRGITG